MKRTRGKGSRTNGPARMTRFAAIVMTLTVAVLAAYAEERDSDGAVAITGDAPAGADTTDDSGVVVIGGDTASGQGPGARRGVIGRGTAEAADKVTGPAPADEATIVQPDTYLEWEPAAGASGYVVHLGTEGLLWRYLDPDGGSDMVVFYSGHGVPGLKDGRGYLLPSDARPDTAEINGYPIDLLYENLGKLQEARSIAVYLDACFSGDSHQGMLVRSASPVYVRTELPAASGEKLLVLTAASGTELASWDEAAEHGPARHRLHHKRAVPGSINLDAGPDMS